MRKNTRYCLMFLSFLFISACNQVIPESTATPIPYEEWPGVWFREYVIYIPTDTPSNRFFVTSTPLPTPYPTQAALQAQFLDQVMRSLEEYKEKTDYIDGINFVKINPDTGYLEIKLQGFIAYEFIPTLSFKLLQSISQMFVSPEFREEFKGFTNADDFYIDLTTVKDQLDTYEFNSVTGWNLMQDIYKGTISMKEWMAASNAGFVP